MPTPGAEATLVSLDNVWFSFLPAAEARRRDSYLFRGLSLELARGECLAVIGPGGEGKTTLLKMIAGLIEPERGTCLFEGVRLSQLGRHSRVQYRRRIGMTFQKSGLFDSLTCGENLMFPLRELSPLGPEERRKKVDEALAEVGLAGQAHLAIPEMSGGMQKRLGIARALLLSPELVLYDDPTAGLDPVTSRHIVDLILQMKTKYQMTLVIVASDPALVYPLADRIAFLYRGDFIAMAPPAEIRAATHPVVKQFVEGLPDGPLTESASPETGTEENRLD